MKKRILSHDIKRKHGHNKSGHSLFRKFGADKRGSFVTMSALLFPILILGGVAVTDIYVVKMKKQLFQDNVKSACFRALKPTRTIIVDDEAREKTAEKLLEESTDKKYFENLDSNVEVDWLDVHVEARADIVPMTNLVFNSKIEVSTEADCNGIPPFPHDGEVILSSNFTDAKGDSLTLTRRYGHNQNCWDIFDYKTFGWDGGYGIHHGHIKNSGVEIQNWDKKKGCFHSMSEPPASFGNKYVIELDGYYNNTIWKELELHPGRYQFSVWYYGRVYSTHSNGISISIEGAREENKLPKTKVIEIAESASKGWLHRTFEFDVAEYEIYKVYLSAEGHSDGVGGLINNFQLIYLDRTNSENNKNVL